MKNFSKGPEVLSISTEEISTQAEALFENAITRQGVPLYLLSYQGQLFES